MIEKILEIGFYIGLGIMSWYILAYYDYKKYIKKYPYAKKILQEFLFTDWKKQKK